MLTAAALKKVALECGADAVGIGAMERFEGAPPEMDPRHLFPRARAVVGLIFRIPRGVMRGLEEGTQFYQYPSMGYGGINEEFAPTVLYQVGRYIEDNGYEACVFRNTGGRSAVSDMTGAPGATESPEEHQRAVTHTHSIKPGRPAPDILLHFRLAAFICGLGEIGYSKMLLTPRFGPMNRQAFIFTDAPLEPDPLYDGPALCNRCMACVRHCPGQCLSATETVRVTVAGRQLEWGRLDEWSCFAYYIGANRASNPFLPPDAFAGVPEREALMRGKKRVRPEEYSRINREINRHYPPPTVGYYPPKCGGCLRACLHAMEQRHALQSEFNVPFRQSKPWQVNAPGTT